jgi:hypothetical protein
MDFHGQNENKFGHADIWEPSTGTDHQAKSICDRKTKSLAYRNMYLHDHHGNREEDIFTRKNRPSHGARENAWGF